MGEEDDSYTFTVSLKLENRILSDTIPKNVDPHLWKAHHSQTDWLWRGGGGNMEMTEVLGIKSRW